MKQNSIFYSVILAFNLLWCGDLKVNQVDVDPRLYHFSFFAPVPDTLDIESFISKINDYDFGKNEHFIFQGNRYERLDVTTNAGWAFHTVHQLYPNLNDNELIVGVAEIESKKEQSCVLWGFTNRGKYVGYINKSFIFTTDNPPEGLIRSNLQKGRNRFELVIKPRGLAEFNAYVWPENRVEISGTVVDADNKPIPYAGGGLSDRESFLRDFETDANGFFEHVIYPFNKNHIYDLYIDGRNDRHYHQVLDGLDSGKRIKLGNVIADKRPLVSGKVLTMDGKESLYSVTVQIAGIDDTGKEIKNRAQDSKSLGVSRQSNLRDKSNKDYFAEPHLWTGIGLARSGCGAAIVGDPDQVYNKMKRYMDIGISSFILSGYPHEKECKLFAKYVLPKFKNIHLSEIFGRVPKKEPNSPLASGPRK